MNANMTRYDVRKRAEMKAMCRMAGYGGSESDRITKDGVPPADLDAAIAAMMAGCPSAEDRCATHDADGKELTVRDVRFCRAHERAFAVMKLDMLIAGVC